MAPSYSRLRESSNHKREDIPAIIPFMGKRIVEILAENLTRLTEASAAYGTIVEVGKRAGLGKSTIDRVKKGESAIRIDNLEALASVFGLAAWQLLHPNLDPRNPPTIDPERSGPPWPLDGVSAQDYQALSTDDRDEVVAMVQMKIDRAAKRATSGGKSESTRGAA